MAVDRQVTPSWARGPVGLLYRLLPGLFRPPAPDTDYEFTQMIRAPYLPSIAPEPVEAQRILRARIQELVRSGGLDHGSRRLVAGTVNSWKEQWSDQVRAEHHARENVLQQREAHAKAEAERIRVLTEQTRAELLEVERRLTVLGVPVAAPDEAAPPTTQEGDER